LASSPQRRCFVVMATIAQSISFNAHGGQARVGEGNKTQAVYTLISEQKYQEGQRSTISNTEAPLRTKRF